MNTIERLEELLDSKDRELEEVRSKLEEIEEQREWRWTLHTDRKEDTHDLPVPRLEMRCEPYYEGMWGSTVWTYCLVYRHFLGHLVWVQIGQTKRTGGYSETQPALDDLPFRDGAHIKHDAATLGLPAFVVIEEKTQRIEPKLSPNAALRGDSGLIAGVPLENTVMQRED